MDIENNKNLKEQQDSGHRRRIIIYIIIIILILLALLTSCSCTSNFFGKIGDGFWNQKDYDLSKDLSNLEVIRNKQLRFHRSYLEIPLSDAKRKLGFSYKNIRPKKFTCTTTDASIATCYVVGEHVVINPKKKGVVTVILQTEFNHKIYEATTRVKITAVSRYIKLSSKNGTIDLAYENEKLVPYSLFGLSGEVKATSSNEKIAKVFMKDGYFKIVAYKTGKVTIHLTLSYNGTTYKASYTLNVIDTSSSGGQKKKKDHDNYLKDIKVSHGTLSPSFDRNRTSYTVTVGEDISHIDIRAIANSDKATITYNGKRISSLKDFPLHYGDNTVIITVRAEDGTMKDYTVTIHREYPNPPKKDHDNYLKDIKVSHGTLSPSFDKNQKEYTVKVDSDIEHIDISAIANSDKAVITYNGKEISSLKDFPLDYGDNKIVITVKAEDGSMRDYIVNVYRESKYTIRFEQNAYLFEMYTDNLEFALLYKVYKNGVVTTDYDLHEIKAMISSKFQDAVEVTLPEKGVVVLKPDSAKMKDLMNKDAKLTISYQDAESTTTVRFEMANPSLSVEKEKLEMSITPDGEGNFKGNAEIIVDTNLFTGEVVVEKSDDGKELKICSLKHKDTCVKIKTDSAQIESLDYDANELGPTSLPIKVVATEEGTATIYVSGTVNGVEFTKPITVTLEIVQKYILRILANGGLFNETTKEYSLELAKGEEADLSLFEEPYKLDENDSCKAYPFKGYSKTSTGEIVYNRTDKKIVKDLTENLILYAIYDEVSIPVTGDMTTYTKWLTDVTIFHNEKYYQEHGEDKVIYPGANGHFIMNYKNTEDVSITITGLTLKEDTICINKKGCLNMGYILRYQPKDANDAIYYYGAKDSYQILNLDTIHPDNLQYGGKMVHFNEPITLQSGEEIAISLFWKWVEIDRESDRLDTLIGNQAALSAYDETINDKYNLFVGVHYKLNLTCTE